MTVSLSKRINALDVTYDVIRSSTEQLALSDTNRRLSFFGHLSHADPCQDYRRDLLDTGDGGLAGPDNPGLEPSKTTCAH